MTQFWNGLDWSAFTEILISLVPAVICLVFHELAHGFAALRLGDTTARDAGRLTLNPLRHLDIFGLIMMAIFKVGYARPVPVDMRNFRPPRLGMVLTALAGPVSNLALAVFTFFVAGLLYIPLGKMGMFGGVVYEMLIVGAYLNCVIAVFNLIPIPPLDGSKVLFGLILPDRWYGKLLQYERYGFIVLIAVVYLNRRSPFLSDASLWLFNKLSVIADFTLSLIA